MFTAAIPVLAAAALCPFSAWCDTAPLFSRTLGGAAGDSVAAITLDASGNILVGGGFIGLGVLPSYITANGFVTMLDPAAHHVIYSTYLGGNCLDLPDSIAAGASGDVWVAGTSDSSTFPQVWPVDTAPPYGQGKAFLTRIAASGAWLWRSSFIAAGTAPKVAGDPQGNAYVGGAGTILLKVGPH